jgi:hypothetical protein
VRADRPEYRRVPKIRDLPNFWGPCVRAAHQRPARRAILPPTPALTAGSWVRSPGRSTRALARAPPRAAGLSWFGKASIPRASKGSAGPRLQGCGFVGTGLGRVADAAGGANAHRRAWRFPCASQSADGLRLSGQKPRECWRCTQCTR